MQVRYVKEKSANSAKWWHFVAPVNIFLVEEQAMSLLSLIQKDDLLNQL